MLKIGIVGARGLSSVAGFQDIEDVELTALCDLDEELLKRESAKYGIKHTYRVYEDMLMSDLDAVVIATPMQLHVPQAMLALRAGKHVMSEVTAGVTMDELFWLVEEVEKSGKVYMMAENYLYTPEAQQVLAMARAGVFGEPYYGEGEYLHNVTSLITYPDGKPSWRSWWQLGRRGIFYPTHSLGPVMKWFGDDHIDTVVAMGSGWHARPDLMQEDTNVGLLQMKSGKLIRLRVDCMSNRPHSMMNYTLQGTRGVYESPRIPGGDHVVSILPEGGDPEKMTWEKLENYSQYLPQRYKDFLAADRNAGHGGGDYFVVKDFVDAVRGIKEPAVSVYDACEWTAVALLSSLSTANSGKAMTMPDFRTREKKDKHVIL